MEFNGNKSIYIQICDEICERILTGELEPDMRIPSVREYGAEIGVNPNTVMRSYEKLTSDNIIYNRRGIGYFISKDARDIVLETMKKDFMVNELPLILKKMTLLGIKVEDLQINEK
jgi:DNA-binding transcriptional regulator YhcF (GntR family)